MQNCKKVGDTVCFMPSKFTKGFTGMFNFWLVGETCTHKYQKTSSASQSLVYINITWSIANNTDSWANTDSEDGVGPETLHSSKFSRDAAADTWATLGVENSM